MPYHIPTTRNGRANLQSIQAMRKDRALDVLSRIRPHHIFTVEEMGSRLLLTEKSDRLIAHWRGVARAFPNPEIENAIINTIKQAYERAYEKTPPPVVTSEDTGFMSALQAFFTTIPLDEATATRMAEEQDAATQEVFLYIHQLHSLLAQGRNAEAVALFQALIAEWLNDLEQLIEQFSHLKQELLELLDSPQLIKDLSLGDPAYEDCGHDLVKRLKAMVVELFDGTDFDRKTEIVQTLAVITGLANALDLNQGKITLEFGVAAKQALDANCQLERRYGLGFIDPENPLLEVRLANGWDLRSLYQRLDSRSRVGLNHFLQKMTSVRLYELGRPQFKSEQLETVGGLRTFATICTLAELGFFGLLKSDISDVCDKLSLADLNRMSRVEIKEAIERVRTSRYAGDAFLCARDVALT
ncbi:MAG: hypothetical protein ACOC4E_01190 [Patescibacteria group bacterium]